MHIDIISLILGALLWELVIAYIHFVAKPRMKRRSDYNTNVKQFDRLKELSGDYKNTKVGFNCPLSKQPRNN